ncbi:hypothetical protein J6590_106142 [Homalodisca vitripennis]|nr:hypothetical protein J6590_106142 [Homalodisca vitripennis]
MRGDSRGAVLTTRTHTLSRSLKILSQIRSHTVCPRTGLGCSVPATAKSERPASESAPDTLRIPRIESNQKEWRLQRPLTSQTGSFSQL